MKLRNLKLLKSDMVKKEKAVVVFRFKYKKINYFVAVSLLTEEERIRENLKFALVKLTFMHVDNIDVFLDCYANSVCIMENLTELRNFFGVEYQDNIRKWIDGFLEYFGNFIPKSVPNKNEEKIALITICRNEGRDPNRIYRYYIFRNGRDNNGKQKYRTEYNAQLASFKYPKLFPKFKSDKTISFAFQVDESKEKTEEDILRDFVERNNK